MTLKWHDGAELWGHATYQGRGYLSGSSSFVTSDPRVPPGTRAFSFGPGVLTTPSLGAQNTWIVGFGLKMTSNQEPGWRFLNANNEQCRIEVFDNGNSTFELRIMRGVTQVAITNQSFAQNVWHFFEAKLTVRTGVNGAFEIRRNESSVLSGSSVNLADTGSDGCDAHSWGLVSGSGCLMDDIYILDDQGATNNNFLGDVVIVGLLPTAEGNRNEFTPSSGTNNAALVDDPDDLPSESDFVSSDTNGHTDLYAYENLPATGLGTIFGIRVITDAGMATVGSRTLRPKFRDGGGSEGNGANFIISGTAVLSKPVIMEQNPVTASAWTASDINNGEFGVEVVS